MQIVAVVDIECVKMIKSKLRCKYSIASHNLKAFHILYENEQANAIGNAIFIATPFNAKRRDSVNLAVSPQLNMVDWIFVLLLLFLISLLSFFYKIITIIYKNWILPTIVQ